ncbi:unnamed protein product, partial [Brenthis ino]
MKEMQRASRRDGLGPCHVAAPPTPAHASLSPRPPIEKRFKVVEFPISFAELSTTRELDIETDLYSSAYLKTTCEGHLMKFDDARNISASHRAFIVDIKSNHVITITFIPKNECISKAKHDKHFDNRNQSYSIQISTPTLMTNEKCLKFGMVTTEAFVTSVSIKIFNNFNLNINFKWEELQADVPFEITPNSGIIPRHSSRICDVQYICKNSKTKTHEVDLLVISSITRPIPFELSVITRKLSIKFLQTAVIFKDIGLNLETTEKVKLENSSRELALFHVVEPLIPGLKIEPMCGTIRPKMIMSFNIIVKIPCILEFAFDICVKINNKENVILPISGNVIEPKIIIHPKNVYMARVPCYMITFVPVTFQNLGTIKTIIEVLDTGDDNIFDVYILQGNERKRTFEFTVEGGQTRTVFVKVYDIFRREYEMYIPFKINGLLGPPNHNMCTTELRYYTEEYEKSVI